MTPESWTKFALSGFILLALVALAILAGHIPALQQLYMQVSGSLLGLLGVHHGHDVLTRKLDDGAPPPPVVASASAPAAIAGPIAKVTPAALVTIMPHAGQARAAEHAPAIQAAAAKWDINTSARLAMWLGNCALECNELREMEEEWIPTQEQQEYEPPHHVAKVLGNTEAGDGQRYKGRGVIQLTGRSNYQQAGHAIGVDLEGNPEEAAQVGNAWDIAGWFWHTRGLNAVADTGDFQETVKRINGGLTDLAQRQVYYDRARQSLA